MNLDERYKQDICINCSNKNCKNRIEETKTQELVMENQIRTVTTVKCKDFICKNKRRKERIFWGGNYNYEKMD